jgi:hypothetical protein
MQHAAKQSHTNDVDRTEQAIFKRLVAEFGELVPPASLWRELGYPSPAAAGMARQRGTLPIKVFEVAGRRGFHAYARDLAHWLAHVHRNENT